MNQSPKQVVLLSNASATGSGKMWPGGKAFVRMVGTWGGATVSLQYLSADNTTWVTAASLTANGDFIVELPLLTVRAAVSGGAPSGLYVFMDWIPE